MSYVTSKMTATYIIDSLNRNTDQYQKYMDQLGTGSKLNTTSDDSIGVSKTAMILNELSANSKALDNISEGDDLLSMTESYQSDILKNLQRIRDLCVQAASESYTASDKDGIIAEIRARLNYINTTASSANFNNINILDGSNPNLTLQVGVNSTNGLNIGSALIDARITALGGDITLGPGVTGATWTTANIHTYMDQIDMAISQISQARTEIGGFRNRLEFTKGTINNMVDGLNQDKSLLSDTDITDASVNLIKYQILQQASVSLLTQTNEVPAWAFSILNKS